MKINSDLLRPDCSSIVFTWDDNLLTHFTHIGSLFRENALKCTYFINPGDINFQPNYSNAYRELHAQGFEIGSHGHSHKYMSHLSDSSADLEFLESISGIKALTNQYPLSFAFPYHDYTPALVAKARFLHLETRNTLTNSYVFHIRNTTSLPQLIDAVKYTAKKKFNLVFSGHGIITEEDILNNLPGEGYQPLKLVILSDFLLYLKSITQTIDVLSFSQAAVREFIKSNSKQERDYWRPSEFAREKLAAFGITAQNISNYL